MKKLFVVALSLILCFGLLTGCGDGGGNSAPDEGRVLKIAIVQQFDHISLEEIKNAVLAELRAKSEEKGVEILCEEFNGQNDASVLNQIMSRVVSGDYDGIIPIASLAAQCAASAVEGSEIPVVYGAVSDPETAGLTGIPNMTGTSDRLNSENLLDMIFAVKPEAKKIGLLYSLSEDNSKLPAEEAKAYLDARGTEYIEKTGNTTDELIAAANALAEDCDAVFSPTDNRVMAAEPAIAEILTEAGVPHFAGADSFAVEGAFAACGVNYTDLGTYTADMMLDALLEHKIPEYRVVEGNIITVNKRVAEKLGMDYGVYEKLGKQVVEVE